MFPEAVKLLFQDLELIFRSGNKSGKKQNYKIGNPAYTRKGISDYKVKKVILSPDEKGLVFVIEKKVEKTDGVSIRYMIETLRF